ncbi:MAG: hypothetical protein LH480_02025 [Rubrivivax sp.]|nr:hypothetical protein [Rubrivivax sp.]
MSIFRLALGQAAAGAAAVMYSNRRQDTAALQSGSSEDGIDAYADPSVGIGSSYSSGMGSTPGTDRYRSGLSAAGTTNSMDDMDDMGASPGFSGIGIGGGSGMGSNSNDDLLSPGKTGTTGSGLGSTSDNLNNPGRSGSV